MRGWGPCLQRLSSPVRTFRRGIRQGGVDLAQHWSPSALPGLTGEGPCARVSVWGRGKSSLLMERPERKWKRPRAAPRQRAWGWTSSEEALAPSPPRSRSPTRASLSSHSPASTRTRDYRWVPADSRPPSSTRLTRPHCPFSAPLPSNDRSPTPNRGGRERKGLPPTSSGPSILRPALSTLIVHDSRRRPVLP